MKKNPCPPKNENVSKSMRGNKQKNTRPEVLFRKNLWDKGMKGYRLHNKKLPGSPDITFKKYKLAIFINGCFWHSCSTCKKKLPIHNRIFWEEKLNRNKDRDKNNIKSLEKDNWKVIVLWECEIKKDMINAIERVLDELLTSNNGSINITLR